jgi:hypothetical protein
MRTDSTRAMRDGTYKGEHTLAWIFGLGALALGVIGTLVSFDIIDLRDLFGSTGVAATNEDVGYFEDSLLFFVPAFVLGLLAWTMHDSEHHVRHYGAAMDARLDRGQRTMYATEHGLAYFGALAAIVLGVIGVLVGYDIFDKGYTWRDGVTWQLMSLVVAGVTGMLHAAGHHQVLAEQDEIDVLIEERMANVMERAAGNMRPTATEPRIVDRR